MLLRESGEHTPLRSVDVSLICSLKQLSDTMLINLSTSNLAPNIKESDVIS